MLETQQYSTKEIEKHFEYSIPLEEFYSCALSVDCVVFGYNKGEISILLVKRGVAPYENYWALPGDLMYPTEDIEAAAQRILYKLTGISSLFMEQVKAFGAVNRHPVGRVITVSYYALVNTYDYNPLASAWAEELNWHPINKIPELAFDHIEILNNAIKKLKKTLRNQPIGFELLPQKFSLNDIQSLYEGILEKKFDKANFRKKLLAMNLLIPLDENEKNVPHRPAKLYHFDEVRYKELKSKGLLFEL